MNVGIIAAMTADGVIGVDGGIPWHYKVDLQRFKRLTMGCGIIFGSKTYASLPGRLTGRSVDVITRHPFEMMLCKNRPDGAFVRLSDAIFAAKGLTKGETVWIGGGGAIYRLALAGNFVDFIDITIVPPVEIPTGAVVTKFPVDLLVGWALVEESHNADDPRLLQRRYLRESRS